ncbi:hypothetical protein ETSB_1102 [cyanobacterium endosymbiont of Epithemia turgida isolate EtSB Lake Yunoko]|nr:hypothetical protein ETSB_1102 [cyanobacterium endosymbiont of Epithemia turgida isolate EtSB Lake Yunoko]
MKPKLLVEISGFVVDQYNCKPFFVKKVLREFPEFNQLANIDFFCKKQNQLFQYKLVYLMLKMGKLKFLLFRL